MKSLTSARRDPPSTRAAARRLPARAPSRPAAEHSEHTAPSDLHWLLERQTPNVGSDGCLLLRGSLGTLRASWMVRRNRGWFRKAPINQTILGACNWVSSGQTRGPTTREQLIERLCETKVLAGFVAEPRIESSADERFAVITSVAAAADGLVFNGFALAGANGVVLVDGPEEAS